MSKYIVIFVTCASRQEATKITERLLGERLVACANIIEGINSFFWWKGRIDRAKELLVIMKSLRRNFGKIKKRIKKLHSYEVPEIIALPIIAGDRTYLKWIDESVKKK